MKEEADKSGFEGEVKTAEAARKKAAINHNDVGDDAPTADETAAAAKAATAKMTFPSGEPATPKDEKVAKVQKDLEAELPAAKEEKLMADKDAAATLAAKVGEL